MQDRETVKQQLQQNKTNAKTGSTQVLWLIPEGHLRQGAGCEKAGTQNRNTRGEDRG